MILSNIEQFSLPAARSKQSAELQQRLMEYGRLSIRDADVKSKGADTQIHDVTLWQSTAPSGGLIL